MSDITSQGPEHGQDIQKEDRLYRQIPLEVPSVDGWKEIKIVENHEPLVALGPFSDFHDIFTSSIYYGEHSNSPYLHSSNKLEGSLITMFARRDVAEQLRQAQLLLPTNQYLIVLDSYRSLEVQRALYDHYLGALGKAHPDWDEPALSRETQKYVSIPSSDATCPSPHNTGGAVDLAIYKLPVAADKRIHDIDARLDVLAPLAPKEFRPLDEATNPVLREQYMLEMAKVGLLRQHAVILDFGTQFDHGGSESALNYFEELQYDRALSPEEISARDNRRILSNIMLEVGMQPYADEWWHYNSLKSQMGARAVDRGIAEYGGTNLSDQNIEHERMRRMHRSGLIKLHEGEVSERQFIGDPLVELIKLNEKAVSETGDPRLTYLSKAAVITPPEIDAA